MGEKGDFILGFDILPSHSPKAKTVPKYSCALLGNGSVLNEYPEVTRGGLLKLIREIQPRFVATDNIFEIVPDSASLFRLVERLPFNTKLVQVTGVPPRQIPLKSLARRHHLEIHGKPSPADSARLAAQLAFLGVGHTIECFSEQTEIKVTRGRKMGRGGQSANRYRRKIHSEIQQMTRHIEGELKEAGIEFDIDVRLSDFGYASARIVAYAPLPAIRGLIETKRGGDFNVLVSPVQKRTEFVPLEPQPVPVQVTPNYFILGIDPGITAALCLLSLTGNVQALISRKSLTKADIIRVVYEYGIPVLVASDVPQTPNLVDKISSSLNVDVFTPNKPIPVSEKQELAREYGESIRIRNAHERDALTAAVYAYRSLKPKLEQIDRKIREEQLAIDRGQLKALVIKGISINEAIVKLTHVQSEVIEEVPEPVEQVEPVTQEKYEALQHKYTSLQDDNDLLLERVEDFERLVEYLRFRESELTQSLEIVSRENYWRVKRDREVAKKQSEISALQQEVKRLQGSVESLGKRLELLKGVKRLEIRGDMIAVKIIPHFTRESIEEYSYKIGMKAGDIVLFEDASGGGPQTAQILIEKEIRAVIVDTPLSHLPMEQLVKAAVPVVQAESVNLQRIDEFAFISKSMFEKQMSEFMKDVKEQARRKSEDTLVEIVEKYKREIDR
jgi:predicted RNase H-like nuclease (RuvC/YqgF family)